MANCGRMVRDGATVKMESIQETTIALSNGAIVDPYALFPPPQMEVPNASAKDQLCDVCGHLVEYGRRYRQDSCLLCRMLSRSSDVAFCRNTLALV